MYTPNSGKKFIDSINQQTSVSSMWRLINRVVKKKPPTALHHTPADYAQQLIDTWSTQSTPQNLPLPLQDGLSSRAHVRQLRLMSAILEGEDNAEITEDELHRAIAKGKATSPGDDDITYSVLRLLEKVPGNPLLRLYNLSICEGRVPTAWTSSTIVPIPKTGTAKFGPVSLTSCFSKVIERILLNRLMFQFQDRLSPHLFGFLPQRGTHHCLLDLYSRLSHSSVVSFIYLQSAFDIANRDIMLNQLIDFGIKGNV